MTPHRFEPTILREYDIRGIVDETLTQEDAFALGAALGTRVSHDRGRTVAVGWDGRLSSPGLAGALAEGLTATGMDVLRIGLGPTPMLYFAARHFSADAGIMVTGSHNPPNYNGFKMVLAGKALYGEDIKDLGRIAAEGGFARGQGSLTERPVLNLSLERLLADVKISRPLTVAWDPGNGATGEVVAKLTARMPGRHLLINEKIDGTFPAHHPDPTLPETLEQLRAVVASENCDLGIAFDGDGDRLGVIDSRGRILWGDQLLVFLSEEILARKPGATVIADVKASQVLFDEIARMGGKPLMWRTGHSLIKAKMAETGAAIAGEMSGHIFIADGYYGFDDAIYAAIRLLNILSAAGPSLAERHDRLPRTCNTPELRFSCSETRKFAVIEEVRARLEQAGAKVNAVDGVRVSEGDGWWLLRASNTQDVLVARCEAASAEGLERLRASLAEQLRLSEIAQPAAAHA